MAKRTPESFADWNAQQQPADHTGWLGVEVTPRAVRSPHPVQAGIDESSGATSTPTVATSFRSRVGSWHLSGWVQPNADGALVISELTISTRDAIGLDHELPTAGLTSGDLRQVPLGRLLAEARLGIVDDARRHADWADPHEAGLVSDLIARPEPTRSKRGPKGYGDDHYRRVAVAYLALQASRPDPRGILADLAEAEHVSRDTIRDWVSVAGERGFLAGAVRGRAGREPGRRLVVEA